VLVLGLGMCNSVCGKCCDVKCVACESTCLVCSGHASAALAGFCVRCLTACRVMNYDELSHCVSLPFTTACRRFVTI
jgi:hypothetical protein